MLYKIILISIIHRKNKSEILLARRNREPEYDKWSLSGGIGALETEADPRKAILKEVSGDFGTNFVDPKLFCVKYVSDPEATLRLYFHGEINEEPKINSIETIKKIKWFTFEEISQIDLAFQLHDMEALNQFREDFLR
jgi:ADP-ribose pyrophosphatase YjhB (NUDIX family)